jgi:regulator of RNase E activity RraA
MERKLKMEWKNDTELFELIRNQLFTAVIGDVLDQRGRHHQFLSPDCQPLAPHMIVAGRAMTVQEEDVSGVDNHQPFGLMLEALDSLEPNEVYVAAGTTRCYALWGELMSITARARGASGAVLAGYSRDTHGILEMDFPVFSHGRYAQDQRGRGKVIAYRVPLEIGRTTINPGEIIFGDIDGVIVIPRELETEVIAEALERSRKEKTAKQDLLQGELAVKVFQKHGVL